MKHWRVCHTLVLLARGAPTKLPPRASKITTSRYHPDAGTRRAVDAYQAGTMRMLVLVVLSMPTGHMFGRVERVLPEGVLPQALRKDKIKRPQR